MWGKIVMLENSVFSFLFRNGRIQQNDISGYKLSSDVRDPTVIPGKFVLRLPGSSDRACSAIGCHSLACEQRVGLPVPLARRHHPWASRSQPPPPPSAAATPCTDDNRDTTDGNHSAPRAATATAA